MILFILIDSTSQIKNVRHNTNTKYLKKTHESITVLKNENVYKIFT